jgi:hypothetical protein
VTWNDLLQLLAVFGVTGLAVGAVVAYLLRQYFEHRLSRIRERDRVAFSRLHEMRAEALAELYAAIVRAEQDLRDWVYMSMPVGIDPPQVEPRLVLRRIRRLQLRATRAKIVLPAGSYAAVEKVVERIAQVSRVLERRDMPVAGGPDAQWEAHTAALEGLDRDVAAARHELERAFREVLEGKV